MSTPTIKQEPPPAGPALQVQDLSAGYGDLIAVRHVDLVVAQATIHLVIGRNGAGKTTMLSAVAGILPLASGVVELGGKRIDHLPPHRRVGLGLSFVQEGKRIFRKLTVEQNLRLGYFPRRHTSMYVDLVDSTYSLFPILKDRRRAVAGSLSGGQQQMLCIAQGLMAEPKVLMLDEPTAGLAPAVSFELLEVIHTLTGRGIAVVLVEQSVHHALEIADDVSLVATGKVVFSRPRSRVTDVDEIYRGYLGVATSIEERNGKRS